MSTNGRTTWIDRLRSDSAQVPDDPWDDGCVSCGIEVLTDPGSRPLMLKHVAEAGFEIMLCDACAHLFHNEQAQKRLARILTVIVMRERADAKEAKK